MDQSLFNNIDIQKNDVHFPDVMLPESNTMIYYTNEFAKFGPVDLQILGIGINGHIAFNEPGSGISSSIRIVKLSQETIERNNAPTNKALTMGISEILQSKVIILMANGKEKCEAIYKAFKEKPSADVPASYLQKHEKLYVITDIDAASLL